MTKWFRVAVSAVAFASGATIAAYAADPTPAQTQSLQSPPQVAVNPVGPEPGWPQCRCGKAWGGNGHWVWMPSNPSPAGASAATGIRSQDIESYSKKVSVPRRTERGTAAPYT
jgi:hypothetical protein